uniref:Ycf80 n=1 Tax=Riquetophycus sp. TaxID=1897556 RepID=A0A1C9C851_9FLOR|nr:hypothetical protein Riqu_070 [Riquetophycus sp.]
MAKTYNQNVIDHSKGKIFANTNNQYTLRSENLINNLADKELIYPSFIKILLNKYWQETIFLSKTHTMLEKYSGQLKSDGILLYKNQYKKFLFNFSKALVSGRVNTNFHEINDMSKFNEDFKDIKYIWRKGFNFSIPRTLSIFDYLTSNNVSQNQLALMKKLKCNKLPLFTVVNNLNQMIIAEPSDQLIINKNPLDYLYQVYMNKILGYSDKRPTYEALLFVNIQDALEYKNSINKQYVNYRIYSNQDQLNIFATTLNFYYQLINNLNSRIRLRLIPDLEELGNLIYKYQYNKNILFHSKQKYGKNYFQGQPIYIIQSSECKNKKDNKISYLSYVYQLNSNGRNENYHAIFMNYKVALLAWKKFAHENKNYILPSKPKILVYNLQEFLKMHKYDTNLHKINMNILLVPNQESYRFIKSIQKNSYNQGFYQNLSSQLLYFKIITQRLIWSLTSRQPTNWQ